MFKIYAIPLMNVGFFLVDWGSILEIYCYSIIKQYQRISYKNLKKKTLNKRPILFIFNSFYFYCFDEQAI